MTQAEQLLQRIKGQFAPPPPLTVSEWADGYRFLSRESASEPGPWRTARAPYQKGIMDSFNDKRIHTIVIMSSAQVGKTEIINNILGYILHQNPMPVLLMQPTLEMAMSYSKHRFAPMVRDTPILQQRLGAPKGRDANHTLLHKTFPGGYLAMVGANSPASLASRPVAMVLCDEVDRYPASAGAEGDPVNIALRRMATFPHRKAILTSTPTIKGASRIELAYKQSNQQRYLVPCPHCGTQQSLEWKQIKWAKDNPSQVHYQCVACERPIASEQKNELLQNGYWQVQGEASGTAGFHLNELYSPWVPWSETVTHFLKAKQQRETLRVWVNTVLGEPWEEQGDSLAYQPLYERREAYSLPLPENILVLTAGVDVQKDRLEVQVDGWGFGFEKWVIDYQVLTGSPAEQTVWDKLDALLNKTFRHPSGERLTIASCFIDSGGHYTSEVYRFTKPRQIRRIYAIKGRSTVAEPIVSPPRKQKKPNVWLYLLGTDTAKELLYSRLSLKYPGPGYCHFHRRLGLEYFKQLTAEHCITDNGKRRWTLKPGRRNEALDVSVYSLACVEALQPDFDALYERLFTPTEPKQATHDKKTESFIKRW